MTGRRFDPTGSGEVLHEARAEEIPAPRCWQRGAPLLRRGLGGAELHPGAPARRRMPRSGPAARGAPRFPRVPHLGRGPSRGGGSHRLLGCVARAAPSRRGHRHRARARHSCSCPVPRSPLSAPSCPGRTVVTSWVGGSRARNSGSNATTPAGAGRRRLWTDTPGPSHRTGAPSTQLMEGEARVAAQSGELGAHLGHERGLSEADERNRPWCRAWPARPSPAERRRIFGGGGDLETTRPELGADMVDRRGTGRQCVHETPDKLSSSVAIVSADQQRLSGMAGSRAPVLGTEDEAFELPADSGFDPQGGGPLEEVRNPCPRRKVALRCDEVGEEEGCVVGRRDRAAPSRGRQRARQLRDPAIPPHGIVWTPPVDCVDKAPTQIGMPVPLRRTPSRLSRRVPEASMRPRWTVEALARSRVLSFNWHNAARSIASVDQCADEADRHRRHPCQLCLHSAAQRAPAFPK